MSVTLSVRSDLPTPLAHAGIRTRRALGARSASEQSEWQPRPLPTDGSDTCAPITPPTSTAPVVRASANSSHAGTSNSPMRPRSYATSKTADPPRPHHTLPRRRCPRGNAEQGQVGGMVGAGCGRAAAQPAAVLLTHEDPPLRSAQAIHINHGDRRGRCHYRASHPSLTLAALSGNARAGWVRLPRSPLAKLSDRAVPAPGERQ